MFFFSISLDTQTCCILTYVVHIVPCRCRFDMLKSANGEINGSLKVLLQNSKKKSDDWTWKEQLEMVKYTNVPISESLLKLDSELDLLAIECFECVMRYMGDLPTTPEFTEVKCVYTILMVIIRSF